MFRRTTLAVLGLAILLGATTPVFAQGVQTGTLKGTVAMPDGSAVPGVLVTVTSDKMQGSKNTTTGEGGSWLIRNLPPGDYVVTFELEGMTPVVEAATAELGGTTNIRAEMNVAGVCEQIEVKSTLPTLLWPTRRSPPPSTSRPSTICRSAAPRSDRHPVARSDHQHAERRPGDDLRRLRL